MNDEEYLAAVAAELDKTFNKPELLAAAEQFGTNAKHNISKADLVKQLADDGVTVELIKSFGADDDEDEPVFATAVATPDNDPLADEEDEELVLVRMTRHNRTYEIRGYTFKTSHPFGLVKESDAEYLVEVDKGFRMASPKEAREYYS